MFARSTARKQVSATAEGRTVYAIGDVHGRLDLLNNLLSLIERDRIASQASARPSLILIGDYIDRGPSSKGVIERIVRLEREGKFEMVALMGNHERSLIQFLTDASVGPIWSMHGGTETLVDYGVRPPPMEAAPEAWETARLAFERALPLRHRDFFTSLKTQTACGDYLFVHAGVRPGVPLSEQTEQDLLTIRRDFLSVVAPLERGVVVHGHTPAQEPFSGPYRINVDTGAYATGVLTAVRLQGTERRFLQARAAASVTPARPNLADFRARWLP